MCEKNFSTWRASNFVALTWIIPLLCSLNPVQVISPLNVPPTYSPSFFSLLLGTWIPCKKFSLQYESLLHESHFFLFCILDVQNFSVLMCNNFDNRYTIIFVKGNNCNFFCSKSTMKKATNKSEAQMCQQCHLQIHFFTHQFAILLNIQCYKKYTLVIFVL